MTWRIAALPAILLLACEHSPSARDSAPGPALPSAVGSGGQGGQPHPSSTAPIPAGAPSTPPTRPIMGEAGDAGAAAPPPAPMSPSSADAGSSMTTPTDGGGEVQQGCSARAVAGDPELRFHHVHFNSVDPAADSEYFSKFFAGKPIEFCKDAKSGEPTRAIQTERGFFLFTHVDAPADPTLNSEIEHVGFLDPMPTAVLQRFMMMNAPIWPPGDNFQCMDVTMGTACFNGVYFYSKAPCGARIEVANSPGPAMMGFGHIHLRGPMPDFYSQLLGPALQMPDSSMRNSAPHVSEVNITNALLDQFEPDPPVETRGKPIDHMAFSTTDLMAAYTRIKAAGIAIAEEISPKPEYGFRSFFVKSPQGIWIEFVEDSPFAAQ